MKISESVFVNDLHWAINQEEKFDRRNLSNYLMCYKKKERQIGDSIWLTFPTYLFDFCN